MPADIVVISRGIAMRGGSADCQTASGWEEPLIHRLRFRMSSDRLKSVVLAHHLIWVLYGWWLPNDPRGSMSRAIASDVISELGALHFGRKRVQPSSREIRDFYEAAATKLKHELLTLTACDVLNVACAFADVIK